MSCFILVNLANDEDPKLVDLLAFVHTCAFERVD